MKGWPGGPHIPSSSNISEKVYAKVDGLKPSRVLLCVSRPRANPSKHFTGTWAPSFASDSSLLSDEVPQLEMKVRGTGVRWAGVHTHILVNSAILYGRVPRSSGVPSTSALVNALFCAETLMTPEGNAWLPTPGGLTGHHVPL